VPGRFGQAGVPSYDSHANRYAFDNRSCLRTFSTAFFLSIQDVHGAASAVRNPREIAKT